GVISDVSRRGQEALSQQAMSFLRESYRTELDSGSEILGSHEFLERFPAFSPFSLSAISDNLGAKKVGGGTYCIKLKIEGKSFLVLNAFYPFMLEYFTKEDRSIVVFEGDSKTAWSTLRQEMVGVTNPTKAVDGSIRRTLLERRKEFGLSEVNQGVNGI